MNPRVKFVQYKHNYKLELTFENGEVKEFDLTPYLNYPVYNSLKNELYCSKVKVFNGTVVWDDDTDIDPDRLYIESKQLNTIS